MHLIRKLLESMSCWLAILLAGAASVLKTRAALQLENIALRHQIGVLQRSAKKRLRLHAADRLLWVWLSRVWTDRRSGLVIVKPETVVAWHRKAFRIFWTWKIRRGKPGRPAVPPEVRNLIRRMSRENPGWGAPRIHGERMITQAAAHVVVGFGLATPFATGIAGSVLLGIGTAMVYPALLAAVGDRAHPAWRATSVGIYRFWRDLGYAIGALMAGVVAGLLGLVWSVHVAGMLTLLSGLVVWKLMRETLPSADQVLDAPDRTVSSQRGGR